MAKLLKGGVVLVHGANDSITPTKADILIQGGRIAALEANISPPQDCEVIDCTDKIISPGFVDSHHHMWQTMLKGLFGNAQFLEYLAVSKLSPSLLFCSTYHANNELTQLLVTALSTKLTPEDMFWGTLAGCMEAIDAGTTTALDHAHLNWTNQHSKPAIAATLTSGMRSVFAYTPTMLIDSVSPIAFAQNLLPDWVLETLESLAKTPTLSDPNCLVKLGFAFDYWFLPKEAVRGIFARAEAAGVKHFTSHAVQWTHKTHSVVQKVHEYGLLNDRMVFSHAGGADQKDIDLLKEAGAFVSTTPNTEAAMTVGPPICFRDDLQGADSVCALGVDCHCATSSSIVNEMRLALQGARGVDSVKHRQAGRIPSKAYGTTDEAFNLGTIQGARALNMEDDIGSIAVGKKADLVIWDALSPAMLGAAQHDPVMAIVLHSGVGDIEAVLVDGVFRKRDGKLVDVEMTEWREEGVFGETDQKIGWSDVGKKLLETQKKTIELIPELNVKELERVLTERFSSY